MHDLHQLPPNTVHLYTMMGKHVTRLPYTACDWTESLKQPGSMNVTLDLSADTVRMGLWQSLHPWKCMLALQNGLQVKHAGPVTDIQWDAKSRRMQVTCGGGLTLLTKRLVLRHELKTQWRDRQLKVDEKNPEPNMRLEYRRTWWWAICVRLIEETKQWADLPIDLPTVTGPGDKQRTYYSWDLATVADRISDIMGLEGGNELRFDPYIDEETGDLRFQFVYGTPYLVTAEHQWSAAAPDSRIDLVSVKSAGTALTTQVWATGGKDADKTLICRRTATPDDGYMLMQSSDTSHTTVTRLSTLQQQAQARLAAGYYPTESFELQVGEEYDVHVGDHADVRVSDDWIGDETLNLKITDIHGSVDSDMLTVTAVERST